MNKILHIFFILLLVVSFPSFLFANDSNKKDSLRWYPENFENTDSVFPPEGWQITDVDGDLHNWFLWNIPADDGSSYAHSGNGFAASASWADQLALSPNNRLISPPVLITPQTNMLSFWVAAQDPDFVAEHFSVSVISSDSGGHPSDTVIWDETLGSSNWSERKLRLTHFEGQTIRVGFRHHACSDMFWIKLDDVNLLPFVNHAPEFITSPDYAVYDQNGYRYNLKAVDEDYDFVHIKPISIPEGFTLTQNQNGTAVITGFCQNASPQYFEIEASDGELNSYQYWTICQGDDFPDFLETFKKKSIIITPNPAKDFIHLEGMPVFDLNIADLHGNKYLDLKNIKEKEKINISILPDGLFMITVFKENFAKTLKLSIIH